MKKIEARVRVANTPKEILFKDAYTVESAYQKISNLYNQLYYEEVTCLPGVLYHDDLLERASDIHYELLDSKELYEEVIKSRNLWDEYLKYKESMKKEHSA